MDKFWIMVMVIAVVAIVMEGVVKLVRARSSRQNENLDSREMGDLEEELARTREDLDDARERITVLEKIVTDDKYDLRRQLDDLAG